MHRGGRNRVLCVLADILSEWLLSIFVSRLAHSEEKYIKGVFEEVKIYPKYIVITLNLSLPC